MCLPVARAGEQHGQTVNKRNMQHIEKEGDSPKDDQRAREPSRASIEQRERQGGGTERHEQKQKRRRVLEGVDEGEESEEPALLLAPRRRIAIEIDGAQQDEYEDEGATENEHPPPARAGFEKQQPAEAVSSGHRAYPWDDLPPLNSSMRRVKISGPPLEQV